MAAWTLLDAENGMCMQHHNCAHDRCDATKTWNLPTYSVRAESDSDISIALAFANKYNIPVSIKTSGHSYSGSSTLKGSILIWMRHFTKYGARQSFTDTCGTQTKVTVKVGGGQVWHEAYSAAGPNYNMIGGGGKTVSAAGGWLQGGGLSAMSPTYGLGIDNVLQFEVILANGTAVIADECSHPDLFWALRGGGGGTFAVVTAVVYRLHDVTPMVEFVLVVDLESCGTILKTNCGKQAEALIAWFHKWVDLQQGSGVDTRWGGYWQLTAGFTLLYFLGTEADARTTLIKDLENWKANKLDADVGKWITFHVRQTASYFEGSGRSALETDPGSHQELEIESRLIPRSWVLDKGGDTAKAKLSEMVLAGMGTFTAYQLGGAVSAVSGNATAIHPAMRTAQWSIISHPMVIRYLQDVPGSGTCLNHHGQSERDLATLWGSNMQKLEEIKVKYDPNNRFNCYHCVGWKDPGSQDLSTCYNLNPQTTPTSSSPGTDVAVTTTRSSDVNFAAPAAAASLLAMTAVVVAQIA